MSDLASFNRTARVAYSDPKFKAQIEWLAEYGIGAQISRGWPREEMAHYVATGQHLRPERRLSLVQHEMPDFGWWEPRYDQPGRREQARYREAGL